MLSGLIGWAARGNIRQRHGEQASSCTSKGMCDIIALLCSGTLWDRCCRLGQLLLRLVLSLRHGGVVDWIGSAVEGRAEVWRDEAMRYSHNIKG